VVIQFTSHVLAHRSVHLIVDPSPRGTDKVAVSIQVSGLTGLERDDPADIVVAVTEDRLRTDVKRGENQGRTLTHAAVVREMHTVAEVTGPDQAARATIAVAPDWRREHLKIASFVQQRRSRRVIATAAVPVESGRRRGRARRPGSRAMRIANLVVRLQIERLVTSPDHARSKVDVPRRMS
jgi:hypothetical protein